jgi:DNA ligase-1
MLLPMLYSRTSTGAVQTWQIAVEGNKYRTVSGQKDGQKIWSELTICQGVNIGRSNATTPEEQAEREARAKWQKKIDRGYHEDESKIDEFVFFEPMLAKQFEDCRAKIEFPVYCQPKLDGMRCIVTSYGMFSRQGKPIVSAPHIYRALKPWLEKDPDLIFDGELYADKFKDDFNAIISLVKKGKPSAKDLEDSEASVQYWIYDLPSCESVFSERHLALRGLKLERPGSPLKVLQTLCIADQEVLDTTYGEYLKDGYEGQIVRIDGPYENKRSKYLLKRKEWKDEEFEITGVFEGVGNRGGTVGYMTFKNPYGKTAAEQNPSSNVTGSRAFVREMWERREELIGKRATIKYFCLTPDGVPRFPYVIAIRDYE